MRITFISDTHGRHDRVRIPSTDMLIHCGDISARGKENEIDEFLQWYRSLDVSYKIFIAGNHDFFIEQEGERFRQKLDDSLIYLENESITIEGIKIWGSPITPFFYNWAFNKQRGKEIAAYWEKIPLDTDILITHGPPLHFGDQLFRGGNAGCKDLLERIKQVEPDIHAFGHIHESYGSYTLGKTMLLNASTANLSYEMVNPPFTIEYPPTPNVSQ